ncbi:hypothetical protein NSU_1947 [Novosphingobium pentaromativorans US6-1]|uniref:Uncharacterized protein n=1 Tax=Novosphingobium pentaromativorans US6-1 TaxID=1088721 RepID=G6EC76_9SPHN|nr:hypothetical protein NSU_1947 [Novosphingobium pentaromativorans US6-1]
MRRSERLAWLLSLPLRERRRRVRELSEAEQAEFLTHWRLWARPGQLPPAGDWRTWLVMAGRGFGKTRAGAEWVRSIAESDPAARIALVGATLPEVRAVMVEGESGLLAISPPCRAPGFEPSLRRLIWPSGAQALLYSAGEPESLRGPQHSHVFRTGRERDPRQRGLCADRCRCALYYSRGKPGAARKSCRRRQLAGQRRFPRRMGRTRTRDCLNAGR